MKILVLHPPMYPVNYDFYNYLGLHTELTVFQYGEYPRDHTNWTFESLSKDAISFKVQLIGKGKDSIKNQLLGLSIKDIKEINPDIVLSIAFWVPSLYFSILSKFLNFKFVILTNAINATEKDNSLLRKLFRKLICMNTNSFISASLLTTDYLKKYYSQKKIYLSIQTIETLQWRKEIESLADKNTLRKELNLPTYKTVLLGVGNFNYKKNWISVIRAMKDIEDCIFVLIGSGNEYTQYLKQVKKMNVASKVLILDRKEGIALKRYFKASDVFVLPSLYEQFGFVVAEALSSDLPVLCSKNVGAASLIKNNENGIIIDPESNFSTDIKNCIKYKDNMKKNAYGSIQDLTLEHRANEFYDIFKEIKE